MNKVSGCLKKDVRQGLFPKSYLGLTSKKQQSTQAQSRADRLKLNSPQSQRRADRLRAEQTGSKQSRQAQSRADRLRADQTGSKQSRQAESRADMYHPNSQNNILGSGPLFLILPSQ